MIMGHEEIERLIRHLPQWMRVTSALIVCEDEWVDFEVRRDYLPNGHSADQTAPRWDVRLSFRGRAYPVKKSPKWVTKAADEIALAWLKARFPLEAVG